MTNNNLTVGGGTKNPFYDLSDFNKVYNEVLGRDIDKGGYQYWKPQINDNKSSIDDLKRTLLVGNEYKDRHSAVAANPNITEAELDALPSAYKGEFASLSDIHHDLTPSTPIDGPNQTPKETPAETPTSSGGGYSGPSMEDIKAMMQEMFSSYENAWTPYGYGWGGTNSNAVRINRSQGSRRGTSYAGNKSSFNRSGSRLNSGTPWMNTLGM